MHAAASPKPESQFPADPVFRRLVSGGSGLAVGGMLASLAAVEMGPGGKLIFVPNWGVPVLFAVGLGLGLRFWTLLWRAQADPTGAGRRALGRYAAFLGVVAFASFAYPLRFLQPERRFDVLLGLVLALVTLSGFGILIYKTIRWVESGEPKDGESE